MTDAPRRPQPSLVDPLFAPYLEALSRGELLAQRCSEDGLQWPPREMCLICGKPELAWEPVSDQGVVHTFTVSHRAFHPYFAQKLPSAVAVVELPEGLRLMGEWDGPIDALVCGVSVRAAPRVDDGAPLLVWVRA